MNDGAGLAVIVATVTAICAAYTVIVKFFDFAETAVNAFATIITTALAAGAVVGSVGIVTWGALRAYQYHTGLRLRALEMHYDSPEKRTQ